MLAMSMSIRGWSEVLWALMPEGLMPEGRVSIEARMRSYKNAAAWDDFGKVFRERKSDPDQARRYHYFVAMVGQAWSLYSKSDAPGVGAPTAREDAGQVKRKDGKIEKVADGVLFPILCALSRFVTFSGGQWSYRPPHVFREADIAYAGDGNCHCTRLPSQCTGARSAYEALFLVTGDGSGLRLRRTGRADRAVQTGNRGSTGSGGRAMAARDRTWLDDVIVALENSGGEAHLSEIYREVRRIRGENGRTLPVVY